MFEQLGLTFLNGACFLIQSLLLMNKPLELTRHLHRDYESLLNDLKLVVLLDVSGSNPSRTVNLRKKI